MGARNLPRASWSNWALERRQQSQTKQAVRPTVTDSSNQHWVKIRSPQGGRVSFARCRTTHSFSAKHLSHLPSDCTTHSCCSAAVPFSIVVCKRLKSLNGSSPFLVALKSTSLSRHTCCRISSTAQILTKYVWHTRPSPLLWTLVADRLRLVILPLHTVLEFMSHHD